VDLSSTIFEQQDKRLVQVTGGLFPDPVAPGMLRCVHQAF
jgi:hypothetical protein